jgi:hypothetical protein
MILFFRMCIAKNLYYTNKWYNLVKQYIDIFTCKFVVQLPEDLLQGVRGDVPVAFLQEMKHRIFVNLDNEILR